MYKPPQNTLSPSPLLSTPSPPERPRFMSWTDGVSYFEDVGASRPTSPAPALQKPLGWRLTTAAVPTVGNRLGSPSPHVSTPPPGQPVSAPGRILSHLARGCWRVHSLTLSSTRVTGEGPAVPRLL